MDLLSLIASALTAIAPIPLEPLGDNCSYYNHTSEHVFELPISKDKAHYYEVTIEDRACFSDWRKDSFRASVRLEQAPVGLQTCVLMSPAMNRRECSKTFYELKGVYGSDNTQKVSIWVFWHPESEPIAGSYKLALGGV